MEQNEYTRKQRIDRQLIRGIEGYKNISDDRTTQDTAIQDTTRENFHITETNVEVDDEMDVIEMFTGSVDENG